MIVIGNAFSLKMLPREDISRLVVIPTSLEDVREILSQFPFMSIIGHEGNAQLLSDLLGVEVPVNRETFTLTSEDTLLVGMPSGGRLPEGKVLSKEELEALQLDWFIVQLEDNLEMEK